MTSEKDPRPPAEDSFLSALAPSSPAAIIDAELNNATDFTITGQHLLLLARLNIGWLDSNHGGPATSGRRPYGNSDMFSDIAEMVDEDAWLAARCAGDGTWEAYVAAHEDEFTRLHAETMIALRIVLQTSQFRSGRFTRDTMGGHLLGAPWQPAPEQEA
jgi:hypothetical protein